MGANATKPAAPTISSDVKEAARAENAAKNAAATGSPKPAAQGAPAAAAPKTTAPAGTAKPKGKPKPASSGKSGETQASDAYSAEVRDAVKYAKDLRGGAYFAGPKQHQAVRDAVSAKFKGEKKDPTPDNLLAESGYKTVKELESVARGEGDRTATKPLRELAKIMPDDAWTKGRHLASILAAWIHELKAAAKK